MNTIFVIFSLLHLISPAVLNHAGFQGPNIETPNRYKYILLSDNGIDVGNPEADSIKFKVKASSNAHIALMSSNTDQDPLYEIVLGGWANSKSVIRDRKQGTALVTHRGKVLKQNEYRTFYIQWTNGHIRVEDEWNREFMEWNDTSNPLNIRNIGVSTGWGSTGYWSFVYPGTKIYKSMSLKKRKSTLNTATLETSKRQEKMQPQPAQVPASNSLSTSGVSVLAPSLNTTNHTGLQESENNVFSKNTELILFSLLSTLLVIVTFILCCLFVRYYRRNQISSPLSENQANKVNTNEHDEEIDIALEKNIDKRLSQPRNDQIENHGMRDDKQMSMPTSIQTIQEIVEQPLGDVSLQELAETAAQVVRETPLQEIRETKQQVLSENN
ncbi:uncharacterized protein LOC127701897 [Mytilus californianus]|uniref:uncharacterized protein LOC127701897 n=1 Tax=Mytilus californianus TaxID=6549 RepID=UPI00224752A6|nr:uncharacterized protein LOC127701897 [Mytilus californianus]